MIRYALLFVAVLFAVPSFAATVSLSGTVTDLSGNLLSGAGVSLVKAGNVTSTSTSGSWRIPATVTGIAIQPKLSVSSAARHLVLEGSHLQLRFDGVDVAGRTSSGVRVIGNAPSTAVGTSVAARSAVAYVDTLLYSWNGRVRARVGIASLSAGAEGVQKIDTSTSSTDIPWNASITYGSLTDARDGQVYRTVKIGTQTWMAQNLNYVVDSSWCYANSADSCVKYGRLYQWASAMDTSTTYDTSLLNAARPHQGICPTGWHVPSDAEWTKLTDTILSSSTAVTVLRSTEGWLGNPTDTGTDVYGFHVLPSGSGHYNGAFSDYPSIAYFWSSSEFSASIAWNRDITIGDASVDRYYGIKSDGFSTRCLEN